MIILKAKKKKTENLTIRSMYLADLLKHEAKT